MQNSPCAWSRRSFLRAGATMAAGAPLALAYGRKALAPEAGGIVPAARLAHAKMAIVGCKTYGPEVKAALKQRFELLGGSGSPVKKKKRPRTLDPTRTHY